MSKQSTSAVPGASRRAVLMGFAAAATPMAPALANALSESAPAGVDPIFAVIREHWEAQEEQHAACYANDLDVEDCPRKTVACRRAADVELPLFSTSPTTLLGAAALIEYVHSDVHEVNQMRGCRPDTVIEYARGFENRKELQAAIDRFPFHIAASLRNIIARGQTVASHSAGPIAWSEMEKRSQALAKQIAAKLRGES
jgi:hypothetical protein